MRNLNLDPKYLLKRWGPPILLLLFFLYGAVYFYLYNFELEN